MNYTAAIESEMEANDPDMEPAPILLLQWSSGEFDEIDEIICSVKKRVTPDRMPHVAFRKVDDDNPDAMLRALDDLLTKNPGAQFLYVSAHGFVERLHFRNDMASPFVDYCDLATVIAKHSADIDPMALVMGSCKAASGSTPLRDLLPRSVTRFVGFSGEPSGGNVAEMKAGVVLDAVGLLAKLSEAVHRPPETSINASEVQSRAEPVLDSWTDRPDQLVSAPVPTAGFIFDFSRDRDGEWHETHMSGELPPAH